MTYSSFSKIADVWNVKFPMQFILKMINCHASFFLNWWSQNHSMVGRDLWRSSCPTPLLKQDHQDLISQGHVQVTFKFLQGKLRNFPDNLCQCSLCHGADCYFMMFRGSFLCFCLYPSSLIWEPLKKARLCLLCALLSSICEKLMRCPTGLFLLQAEQNQFSI